MTRKHTFGKHLSLHYKNEILKLKESNVHRTNQQICQIFQEIYGRKICEKTVRNAVKNAENIRKKLSAYIRQNQLCLSEK